MSRTSSETLTAAELADIDRANEAGRRPVLFVHGLWLLSTSWNHWRTWCEDEGYATVAPGWPGEPDSVERARAAPEALPHPALQEVTAHYLAAVARLRQTPAVVGHSFGGLIAQQIAGAGAAAVTVAISPAPFHGLPALPLSSFESAFSVLTNPANAGRAVTLTFEQFAASWANALPPDEARALYDEFHVAAPCVPLFQAAATNLNPFSATKVDTAGPDRGPLLLIAGEHDHTVPFATVYAAYHEQQRNPGVTKIVEMPGRGHTLVIDHGWRAVAEEALSFIRSHDVPGPRTA